MKFVKFLLAIVIIVPFLGACQADLEDTGDPRDVIVKTWRVSDDHPDHAAGTYYDVRISKDANEPTQIIINNIHELGTNIDVVATLANRTISITSQEVPGGYTIAGGGTVSSDNANIDLICTETTLDETITVNSHFGPLVKKKKKTQAKKALQ